MTPIEYAETLVRTGVLHAQAEGVAIIARGLSDDDGYRAGWPVEVAVPAAAKYLGLTAAVELVELATAIMPTIPDHILNKSVG